MLDAQIKPTSERDESILNLGTKDTKGVVNIVVYLLGTTL